MASALPRPRAAWTDGDARSWWDQRMQHVKRLVRQSAETPSKSGPRTAAIDFAERATAEA